MLHESFIAHLEQICSEIENKPVKLRAYETVYGGDINRTYRLAMSDKDYFIKVNTAEKIDMFEKETQSLNILSSTDSFRIPNTYAFEIFEDKSFLLMEFIESLDNASNPKNFAENLVRLHQTHQNYYGLDKNNYIGKLYQKNTLNDNWVDFFIRNRLQFQIDLAKDSISTELKKQFEKLYQKLPEILSVEKASLLHGDLWNGNCFYDQQGQAVLFDPAIYYGHRETDLAMMSLFGGFDPKIYARYESIFPLEPEWKERIRIYQLYPLLVHFNLFGNSYLTPIRRILKLFV